MITAGLRVLLTIINELLIDDSSYLLNALIQSGRSEEL